MYSVKKHSQHSGSITTRSRARFYLYFPGPNLALEILPKRTCYKGSPPGLQRPLINKREVRNTAVVRVLSLRKEKQNALHSRVASSKPITKNYFLFQGSTCSLLIICFLLQSGATHCCFIPTLSACIFNFLSSLPYYSVIHLKAYYSVTTLRLIQNLLGV